MLHCAEEVDPCCREKAQKDGERNLKTVVLRRNIHFSEQTCDLLPSKWVRSHTGLVPVHLHSDNRGQQSLGLLHMAGPLTHRMGHTWSKKLHSGTDFVS